ncbi:hypothetical protein ACOME3_003177 [Neoechinorhynchus agilis]
MPEQPTCELRRILCKRRSYSRANAWGEGSYADLIAKAIQSSPEKRLTLLQIYQWFIDNVEYFRQRSGEEERRGWQNCVRHNLSIGETFLKVPNKEGRSSFWEINPKQFEPAIGYDPRRKVRNESNFNSEQLYDQQQTHSNEPMLQGSQYPQEQFIDDYFWPGYQIARCQQYPIASSAAFMQSSEWYDDSQISERQFIDWSTQPEQICYYSSPITNSVPVDSFVQSIDYQGQVDTIPIIPTSNGCTPALPDESTDAINMDEGRWPKRRYDGR